MDPAAPTECRLADAPALMHNQAGLALVALPAFGHFLDYKVLVTTLIEFDDCVFDPGTCDVQGVCEAITTTIAIYEVA